jgi:hypothetical protein
MTTRVPYSMTDAPVNAKAFGAKGDGIANDTAAIQAAVAACPSGGTLLLPPGKYKITDQILLTKPITVKGGGISNVFGDYTASSDDYFAGVWQTTAGKPAFKLVASLGNYAFNAYGILGVNFQDLQIVGPSSSSYAVAAITTDTTVNAGDYHIRHCHLTNVAIRYFTTGVDFTGIAYLNVFTDCLVYACTTGIKIAKGAASDNGGQTRFFGCTVALCGTCVSLNEDGSAGSFAFFGCTLSESQYGIRAHEECVLTVTGCEFESLTNSGTGAGIYVEIKEANPNSGAAKTIVGNKFLTNDADIWVNKTTSAFAGGGFAWPMLIDGNTLNSTTALKVTVPSGHVGLDSPQFVLGAANAGTSGPLASSQVSANFFGHDARKRRITRRYTIPSTWTSGATVDVLPIGMVLQTVRVYLTANASGFTALQLGHQTTATAYAFFDAQAGALNTWTTYTSTLGLVLTDSTNRLVLGGSAGWLSTQCVIEVDGYVP